MSVESRSLHLTNLLSYTLDVKQEDFFEPAFALTAWIAQEKNYSVGPLIFTREPLDDAGGLVRATYMKPVGIESATEQIGTLRFIKDFSLDTCLFARKYPDGKKLEDIYQEIEQYAAANQIHISKPYYHVMLDFYGEMAFDVYAPIHEV